MHMTNTNADIAQRLGLTPANFIVTEQQYQYGPGTQFNVTCTVPDVDGDRTWGHFPSWDAAKDFIRSLTRIAPTRAGELVQDSNGRQGITTDYPRKRSPQIAVQYIGGPYPVLAQIADLTAVTTITEGN